MGWPSWFEKRPRNEATVVWEATITCGITGKRKWLVSAGKIESALDLIFAEQKVTSLFAAPAGGSYFDVFEMAERPENQKCTCAACSPPWGVAGMFRFGGEKNNFTVHGSLGPPRREHPVEVHVKGDPADWRGAFAELSRRLHVLEREIDALGQVRVIPTVGANV